MALLIGSFTIYQPKIPISPLRSDDTLYIETVFPFNSTTQIGPEQGRQKWGQDAPGMGGDLPNELDHIPRLRPDKPRIRSHQ